MRKTTVFLEELMVHGQPSLDPRNSPNEEFELFSIPAYERLEPDYVLGSEVGSSKKIVEPGDLLLSRIVPHIRRAWVVPTGNGKRQIASGEWIVFRHHSFEPRYLRHFVMSDPFHAQFMNTVAGVGGSLVRARPENVGRIEVSLPPLSEQKRIADILDKADAIRRKRQEAIDALLSIPGSTFHEMFGTPVHNTKGWKIGTIRDLVCEVKYGSSSKASSEGQYPMLRMNNITYAGTWDLTDLKYIDIPLEDRAKYLVQKGDILFNRTNSKELVGKTAVFQEEAPMAFAGYLVRARTNELAHPDYIAGYLNSPHGKATLRHMCKSIIGMANINAQEFQDILIPHPPIKAQLEFVQVLNAVRRSERSCHEALKATDHMFNSLVQRAFSGCL